MTSANLLTLASPFPMPGVISSPSFSNFNLNATDTKIAWAFQSPSALTITDAVFRYGARAGTPPTYRVSLQSLDATGLPDGTVLGGGTPASATFTPPADTTWDGSVRVITLDNSYVTTRGQHLALVIDYSSGTINGSNRSSFTQTFANAGAERYGAPYSLQYATGGPWSKASSGAPLFGVKTASSTYGVPIEAFYSTATAATNGHRVAMKFTLNSGFGDTFKVSGLRARMTLPATGNTFKLGLWDATSLLQSATIDADYVASVGADRTGDYLFTDTTLATLSFGTAYYIGVEVSSSAALTLWGIQVDSAGDVSAFPGGTNFTLATYNGSVWSDNTSVRPIAELILDDITEPSGSSGGNPYLLAGLARG